ncbi:MAG: Trk system potassium transporter TrkA [Bdellovibrionales bacterium]|nr:Trk system potassium transporter TrkA [Bdellovibrionales bacterium]MBT3526816.1 Trk system potassium transporter TrkA [Bdellovibrionales bacterium]MBT7765577.1 Trk system potassium transporter TrkA [Bdellovibrionales bacterium]
MHLAKTLSGEGHEVTIVEKCPDSDLAIYDKIDCLLIPGNGQSEEILLQAGVVKSDLLIAVTDNDEVNLTAAKIAKAYGVPQVVARVVDTDYFKTGHKLTPQHFGVDFLVRPISVTAHDIVNMIQHSNATEAFEFARKEVTFACYTIKPESPLVGEKMKAIFENYSKIGGKLVSSTRNKKMVFPREDMEIAAGDTLAFICKHSSLISLERYLGHSSGKKKSLFVLGGGRIALEVVKRLSHKNYVIKIIDRSKERCEELTEALRNSLVLCTDDRDIETMKSEGIAKADFFLAMTPDDQTNILTGLLAKQLGVNSAICIVDNMDYIHLATSLGINSSVNPRLAISSAILKYLRGDNVRSLAMLEHVEAEVIEFVLGGDSSLLGTTIINLKFPEGVRICAIVRHSGQVIFPGGKDIFSERDHVILLCRSDSMSKVEPLFAKKIVADES